jgi:hypothetical protein
LVLAAIGGLACGLEVLLKVKILDVSETWCYSMIAETILP